MNKILVVAKREYTAAVRTKAFLVSLLLMPILMFGGIFVQNQTRKLADTNTYKVAVLDRTPGGRLAEASCMAPASPATTSMESVVVDVASPFVVPSPFVALPAAKSVTRPGWSGAVTENVKRAAPPVGPIAGACVIS